MVFASEACSAKKKQKNYVFMYYLKLATIWSKNLFFKETFILSSDGFL